MMIRAVAPRSGPGLAVLLRGAMCLAICAIVPALTGCGPERFQRTDLYEVAATNYGAPVMFSRVAEPGTGRPMRGSSGRSAQATSSTYSSGSSQVTVTTSSRSESELGASRQVLAQTNRAERWIQITNVEYQGYNFSAYGVSQLQRTLVIEADAHR